MVIFIRTAKRLSASREIIHIIIKRRFTQSVKKVQEISFVDQNS